ncbi:MAG TPA: MerR family transcriptional regulator [Acidobacteriota bacterium]|nr:MerR family transcriptional regulator [Acidobacteriota bacterium]
MTARKRVYYSIGQVAEAFSIHQQTLRQYERLGLLKPTRTQGNTRLYCDRDLGRLEVILNLTRELGVNLAGVEIILNMRDKMEEMQRQTNELVRALQQAAERYGIEIEGRNVQSLVRVNRFAYPIKR